MATAERQPVGSTFTQKLAQLKQDAPLSGFKKRPTTMGLAGLEENIQQLTQQRAAVSGRAPSQREIAGVVQGLSADAQSRLERREEIDLQKQMHEEGLQAKFDLQGNEITAANVRQENELQAGFAMSEAQIDAQERAQALGQEHEATLQERGFGHTEQMQQEGFEQAMRLQEGSFAHERALSRERIEADFNNLTTQIDATTANLDKELKQALNMHRSTEAGEQRRFWASEERAGEEFSAQLAQQNQQFKDSMRTTIQQFNQTYTQSAKQFRESMDVSTAQFATTKEQEYQMFQETLAQQSTEANMQATAAANSTRESKNKWSWVCTALRENSSRKASEMDELLIYVKEHHGAAWLNYLAYGKALVDNIAEDVKDLNSFYFEQGVEFMAPICASVRRGEMEKAYWQYTDWVAKLIADHAPYLMKAFKKTIAEDMRHGE